MAISLNELISKVPLEVEQRVRRTRDKERATVQDALRAETRLAMRTAEEAESRRTGAQVPVEIAPGYPEILGQESFPDEHILLLARHRPHLEQTIEGVTGLLELRRDLSRLPDPDKWIDAGKDCLQPTLEWALRLLESINRHDPLSHILKFNEDVLGVYEYQATCRNDTEVNGAAIVLYWGVIGLVADWLGCSVEDLTVVVLTHELAHAYTQLGADIDGRRWPSARFAKAENCLKEGLAQYYTERVLKRLERRYSGAFKAYESLLSKQHGDYKVHQPWIERYSPEAVRRAMIEVRRWEVLGLKEFEARLDDAARSLRPARGNLFE